MFNFHFSVPFLVQFGHRIILQVMGKINAYSFRLSSSSELCASTDFLLFFQFIIVVQAIQLLTFFVLWEVTVTPFEI